MYRNRITLCGWNSPTQFPTLLRANSRNHNLEEVTMAPTNYSLFLYKEELRLRRTCRKTVRKAKLRLTEDLISDSMRKLLKPSYNDLMTIFAEMLYKEKLEYQIICDQEKDINDTIADEKPK
ncbi:hypothetical protein GQX74_009751 [Glossina fuscipes]|nr:hypothetical protein GQX74_009751 [Glossina fuscipes]